MLACFPPVLGGAGNSRGKKDYFSGVGFFGGFLFCFVWVGFGVFGGNLKEESIGMLTPEKNNLTL